MIKQIDVKNVATYDSHGVQINDLKKINIIYGANGCGKTTLSNFLHNTSDSRFSNCSLTWQNALPLKILVYNKEFRERNFGKGKLSGVFTLGEATTEQIKIIEQKSEELKAIKTDLIRKHETLEKQKADIHKLENDFKETAWIKIYKKHEVAFKESFVGSMQKELFKNKLLQEFSNNTAQFEPLEALKTKAKTIFGEQPQSIDPISQILFDRVIQVEESTIWQKIIVGKADVDIARLIFIFR